MIPSEQIQLYSTCPPCSGTEHGILDRLVQVARWSEAAKCDGCLIYSDNSLLDPWLIAQFVIQNTRSLSPLVAVQPVYMHPYTAAKQVASLTTLYQRRVHLNMIAGGFKNDLVGLGDSTPHDQRYERLVEYTQVIRDLLSGHSVTIDGRFYQVRNLILSPRLPEGLSGDILMSGSSPAGLDAAARSGSIAIQYPEPPEKRVAPPAGSQAGVRLGIIARQNSAEAWDIAERRFPEDRKGQITRALATKVSDSLWHQQLSANAQDSSSESSYWLRPFQHYQTNCPYLVGSHEEVAGDLSQYLGLGYRTLIVDIPGEAEDLEHTRIALNRAIELHHKTHSGATVTA